MRKLLSTVLAMVLMLTFSVSALAQTREDKLKLFTKDINISATITDENGVTTEVEPIVIVEQLPIKAKSGGNMFKVTARYLDHQFNSEEDSNCYIDITVHFSEEGDVGSPSTYRAVSADGGWSFSDSATRAVSASLGFKNGTSWRTTSLSTASDTFDRENPRTTFYSDAGARASVTYRDSPNTSPTTISVSITV